MKMIRKEMKSLNLLIVCSVFIYSGCMAETEKAKPDVINFIDNADTCTHLSGEWDNSLPKQRQQEIEKDVDKYCGLAKEQQKTLTTKYKGNKDIENKISRYSLEFGGQ